MYLYKSLFKINKLNQNLVSFACSHCVRGLSTCGGSQKYGFVLFITEVCVRSSEYVFKGSFSHLHISRTNSQILINSRNRTNIFQVPVCFYTMISVSSSVWIRFFAINRVK